MAVTSTQETVAVNRARSLVFFPNGNTYNYKTGQWTYCEAYSTFTMFDVNAANSTIGLIVFSSGSVDFQEQTNSGAPQTALIETGGVEIAPGQRVFVGGVRPLANGGTYAIRVGTQDNIGDAVTWSASTTVTARTGKADVRETGRYARVELTVTGGFTTILGADVDFSPTGFV